jgi:hypothetical protein
MVNSVLCVLDRVTVSSVISTVAPAVRDSKDYKVNKVKAFNRVNKVRDILSVKIARPACKATRTTVKNNTRTRLVNSASKLDNNNTVNSVSSTSTRANSAANSVAPNVRLVSKPLSKFRAKMTIDSYSAPIGDEKNDLNNYPKKIIHIK